VIDFTNLKISHQVFWAIPVSYEEERDLAPLDQDSTYAWVSTLSHHLGRGTREVGSGKVYAQDELAVSFKTRNRHFWKPASANAELSPQTMPTFASMVRAPPRR
jgi:hypothetical protein